MDSKKFNPQKVVKFIFASVADGTLDGYNIVAYDGNFEENISSELNKILPQLPSPSEYLIENNSVLWRFLKVPGENNGEFLIEYRGNEPDKKNRMTICYVAMFFPESISLVPSESIYNDLSQLVLRIPEVKKAFINLGKPAILGDGSEFPLLQIKIPPKIRNVSDSSTIILESDEDLTIDNNRKLFIELIHYNIVDSSSILIGKNVNIDKIRMHFNSKVEKINKFSLNLIRGQIVKKHESNNLEKGTLEYHQSNPINNNAEKFKYGKNILDNILDEILQIIKNQITNEVLKNIEIEQNKQLENSNKESKINNEDDCKFGNTKILASSNEGLNEMDDDEFKKYIHLCKNYINGLIPYDILIESVPKINFSNISIFIENIKRLITKSTSNNSVSKKFIPDNFYITLCGILFLESLVLNRK